MLTFQLLLTLLLFVQFHLAKECDSKHYGDKCLGVCANRHCKDDYTCDPHTGLCQEGCLPRWSGLTCMEITVDGHWTNWTRKSVGMCQSTCNQSVTLTRTCTNPPPSNYGLRCPGKNIDKVWVTCTGGNCSPTALAAKSEDSGTITIVLIVLVIVVALLIAVCIFIYVRLKKKQTETESTKMLFSIDDIGKTGHHHHTPHGGAHHSEMTKTVTITTHNTHHGGHHH